MLEWVTVIALILLGIALIVVEIIFVPGTTIIGILGFVCSIIGIYFSFENFGTSTGVFVLLGSVALALVAVALSFRSGVWKKFALNDQNTGKVNEDFKHNLDLGSVGTAISDLKPIGKAVFDDKELEVTTTGNLVESGERIKVVKLIVNKIIVEPIN